jgi:hypothetical protein
VLGSQAERLTQCCDTAAMGYVLGSQTEELRFTSGGVTVEPVGLAHAVDPVAPQNSAGGVLAYALCGKAVRVWPARPAVRRPGPRRARPMRRPIAGGLEPFPWPGKGPVRLDVHAITSTTEESLTTAEVGALTRAAQSTVR